MSLAVPINLHIDSGSDWEVTFNLREENGNYKDLTGYSVSCKMARNYTTNSKYNLNPQILDPLKGLIRLSMPNEGGQLITKTQDLKSGRYVYSLFVTDPYGRSEKTIEGIITVTPSVR